MFEVTRTRERSQIGLKYFFGGQTSLHRPRWTDRMPLEMCRWLTGWARMYPAAWDDLLSLHEVLWAWSRVQHVDNRTLATLPIVMAATAEARATPDEMAIAEIKLDHPVHLYYSPAGLRLKPLLEATGTWTMQALADWVEKTGKCIHFTRGLRLAANRTSAWAVEFMLEIAEPEHSQATSGGAKRDPIHSEMQRLLKHYSDSEIDGRSREFPMKSLIVGAEKILARVWHERWVPWQYTPMHATERVVGGTLLRQHWRPESPEQGPEAEEPRSPRRGRGPPVAIVIEDDQSSWTPKSLISIMDALDATSLCWTLCRLGHELEIQEYHGMVAPAVPLSPKQDRTAQGMLDAGWKMALDMRSGTDFATASQQVMEDTWSPASSCLALEDSTGPFKHH